MKAVNDSPFCFPAGSLLFVEAKLSPRGLGWWLRRIFAFWKPAPIEMEYVFQYREPEMNVTGSDALRRKFQALGRNLSEEVLPSLLRDGADTFADEVRSRAPVDTGALRETVRVNRPTRKGDTIHASVEVGDSSGSVGPVEFGKIGQSPNPFIRRSFASKAGQVKARIVAGIARAVRSAR